MSDDASDLEQLQAENNRLRETIARQYDDLAGLRAETTQLQQALARLRGMLVDPCGVVSIHASQAALSPPLPLA